MTNEIAILEDITEDKWPEIYGVGKVNDYYDRVKDYVSQEVPDLTTKKGRDAIISLASQVSSSKVAVEKPGRAYLKYIKETKCKAIEDELREFVALMDKLRDDTRKPVTDYEAEQKALKEKQLAEAAAKKLQDEVDRDHELAEFMYAEYLREKEAAAKQALIDAELAIKAQQERDELIAKEAAERATREANEAAEKAERERLQAIADTERRIANEKAAADAIAEKQAANKANQKRKNNEALDDLMELGLTKELATAVVVALAKDNIRNCSINY